MRDLKNMQLGLLELTLIEFKKKGYSSLEEIIEYLKNRYRLTVTKTVLRKRLDSLGLSN